MPYRQYQRTAHRITSPWKWRHLKSVIVPSVQSPPSMLKLHDFCNRARIKMGIGTGRCQDGVQIEALLLWPIVEMKMRLFGEMRGRNPVEESRPRALAPTIMEFKRRTVLRHSLGHCE